MHKVASWDCPAFGDTGKRDRAGNREIKVVGGADSEISEELDVLDAVGS